jgi:RNA polymerase sigma-70 factor (ECF subfamily)
MSQSSQRFLKQVFRQYHQELHGYLVNRLKGHPLEAADIAQETYLRILRMKNADFVKNPHAYVYSIASNVIRELGLKEQTQANLVTELDQDSQLPQHVESAEKQADRLIRLQHLDQTIEKMPPMYRAVLVLRKRDGMSHQEIADKLNISKHTVKKYLFRAITQCREHCLKHMEHQQ